VLGDTTTQRDWGHAADYVRACGLMLQQAEPGRLRDCHGELHNVPGVVEAAFATVQLEWPDHVKARNSGPSATEPLGLWAMPRRHGSVWAGSRRYPSGVGREMTEAELSRWRSSPLQRNEVTGARASWRLHADSFRAPRGRGARVPTENRPTGNPGRRDEALSQSTWGRHPSRKSRELSSNFRGVAIGLDVSQTMWPENPTCASQFGEVFDWQDHSRSRPLMISSSL